MAGAVGTEGGAGQKGDPGLAQQSPGKLALGPPRPLHIGEHVERARGAVTAHSGEAPQSLDDDVTPGSELLDHGVDGGVRGATAACWVNAAAHEEVLIIRVSIRCASATGMTPKPSRQPHIAHALLSPSMRMVRSAMPGMPYSDTWSPSYTSRE